jgi:hypothetical protein
MGGFPGGAPYGGGGGGPPGTGGTTMGTYTPYGVSKTPKPYAKPDTKAYPRLKDIAKFDHWYQNMTALSRAHGLENVFDPNYAPDPNYYEQVLDFWFMQAFMYAVLCNVVGPIELRQYVLSQRATSDAQRALNDIVNHMKQSTYAVITTGDMMVEITSTRFDARKWARSALEFIIGFDELMTKYNDLQRIPAMQLNDVMRRTYMQQAVRQDKSFQAVSDREQDQLVMGHRGFTYPEYLQLLKSKAARMDATRRPRSIRDVETHNILGDHEDELEVRQAIMEANVTKSGEIVTGSRMPLSTWKSLSEDTQTIWDTIDANEKAKILAASKGEPRTQRRNIKLAEQGRSEEINANVHDKVDSDEDTEDEENPSMEANTALSTARMEAHPGDPRRMMGTNTPS